MERIVIPNIERLPNEPTAPGKISIEVTRRTLQRGRTLLQQLQQET